MVEQGHTLEQIEEQLTRINTLLSDATFMLTLAGRQEASYYTAQGKIPPAFPPPADMLIHTNAREERIAFYLTGFYALECSMGAFRSQQEAAPVFWLQQMMQGRLQADNLLLLQCFASATYQAGQAFYDSNGTRSLELPPNNNELMVTVIHLINTLQALPNPTAQAQREKIDHLLRDPGFALELAQQLERADPFLPPATTSVLTTSDNRLTIERKALDQQIAINVAGAYALEAGLTYFGYSQNKLPSQFIEALLADAISPADKDVLERFAHATWKAGQPFRGLDRITRPIFMSFDLLSAEERAKDWIQVQSAAAIIGESL